MKKRTYLAVDLGASSGRVIAGCFDGRRLHLEEAHRFANTGCRVTDGWHWQILGLFAAIKKGLGQAGKTYGRSLVSAGVDTWGVDYGLVDRTGRLLGLPYMYRDERTNGVPEKVSRSISSARLYSITGLQSMPFNTLYQLCAEKAANERVLDAAHRILFTPDLIHYWLSGRMANEYTIASTSQMLDAKRGTWSKPLLESLGLPAHLFKNIVAPGSNLGPLLPDLRSELGISSMNIVVPGSHDTASAVAAVPTHEKKFAYLSSGTWSLLGTEINKPLLTEAARSANFTNEGGVGGTIRLLKNITGLWLIQECQRVWSEQGRAMNFTEIAAAAREAKPFAAVIDPDDASFSTPGDMPARIRAYCRSTGQRLPSGEGAMARVIYESLALRYRQVLLTLQDLTATTYNQLHIVGGGSQNVLLNQLVADSLQKPVCAGPAEATAIGNILMQMIAAGDLRSLDEGRALVRDSFEMKQYQPASATGWDDAHARFAALAARRGQ